MARFERRRFGGRRFGDRDRGFSDRVNIPRPVKEGEEYDVEISEVGSRGDGIARVKNFVVFVSNTKQGEKAHIKIKEVRDRFATGEKVEGSGEKVEGSEAKEEVAEETAETEGEETTEEAVEESEEVTEEEVEEDSDKVEETEE